MEQTAGDRLNAMQQASLAVLNHANTETLSDNGLTLYDVLGDLAKLQDGDQLIPIIDLAMTGAQSLTPEEKAAIEGVLTKVGTEEEMNALDATLVSLVQRIGSVVNPSDFCIEIPSRITHARTRGAVKMDLTPHRMSDTQYIFADFGSGDYNGILFMIGVEFTGYNPDTCTYEFVSESKYFEAAGSSMWHGNLDNLGEIYESQATNDTFSLDAFHYDDSALPIGKSLGTSRRWSKPTPPSLAPSKTFAGTCRPRWRPWSSWTKSQACPSKRCRPWWTRSPHCCLWNFQHYQKMI